MKFEYIVGFIQLFFFFISLRNGFFKVLFLSFLVSLYGPLYSLVNIPTNPKLTFNFVSSVIIFLLTFNFNRINSRIYYYKLFILFLLFVNLLFNQIAWNSFFKFIQILLLIFAAFSFGSYIANSSKSFQILFIKYICAFMSLGGVVAIFVRLFQGTTIRDAGFGLFHIFVFIFLCIRYIKEKSFYLLLLSLFALVYLVSIQTRSILALLFIFISLFYVNHLNFAKIKYLFLILVLMGFSFIILYSIRNEGNADFDSTGSSFLLDPSFIMRVNALSVELQAFYDNILFGKGLLFNDVLALHEINNVRDGAYVDGLEYSAYNHIGISSILGQSGLYGFCLFILYPLIVALRAKKTFKNYSISRAFSILIVIYFISYFISGSPIRSDFQDMFWYYFSISFLIVSVDNSKISN